MIYLHILKFYEFQLCSIIPGMILLASIIQNLLAYLVELFCLLRFVEHTGPNSTFAEISLLVEMWVYYNFYHCQEKGNYLVRTMTGIRKLPKGFQKLRYFHFPAPKQFLWGLPFPFKYSYRKIKKPERNAMKSY